MTRSQSSSSSCAVIRFIFDELMENTRYFFHVSVSNPFGDSNRTASVEISESPTVKYLPSFGDFSIMDTLG